MSIADLFELWDDAHLIDNSETLDFVNKELIREIKIKMLCIENNLTLIYSRFNFNKDSKFYQHKVNSLKHLGVLCGSFSLYVYGLLDRQPKDIDILVDKNSDVLKSFIKDNQLFINLYKDNTSFFNRVKGFNNVEQFKKDGILIDLFHEKDLEYDIHNGIKIQNPFQVIKKKIDIYEEVRRSKDYKDLKLINKRLENILEKQEDRKENEFLVN